MKFIVFSTDGFGPKMFDDHQEAYQQGLIWLYLCDDNASVKIFGVDGDYLETENLYWEELSDEAIKMYDAVMGEKVR